MKRILLLALLSGSPVIAEQDVTVTYLATQASVQDIVRSMASQAGLGYNWQRSFDQTNPLCRRWVRDVRAEATPFATAMDRILRPNGLRYEVENGTGVLFRAEGPRSGTSINYSTAKKSVQYIVIDLAAQVGLGYNWEKSFAQTAPECRRFVFDVVMKDLPFAKAMAEILDPVGLRFEVEAGKVALYRQGDKR
jgi:hypothetical protein